ncbi:MAG: EAL domain-containing protein [Gammaproteobacteria bacterium]|nr:EAL domain-containing protein [Gammaproteobacteria bacterium]
MNKEDTLVPNYHMPLLHKSLNQTKELIMLIGLEGIIIYGNDSVEKITGYCREEYIGQTCRVFKSGVHDQSFYRDLWQTLLAGRPFSACFVNRHRNGMPYYENKSITPVRNNNGEIIHFFSISKEVTLLADNFVQQDSFIHYDQMTRLPNRHYFLQKLADAIVHAGRRNGHLAVFSIDLDHFNNINDILGHKVGDEVIKTTANRIKQFIRSGDTCARLGGDEFLLLVEDIVDVPRLGVMSSKLVENISETINVDDNELHVTCSIGISVYPKDGSDCESLLKCADQAMYRAKNMSMGRFVFYREENTEEDVRQNRLHEDIHNAVTSNQLKLYYQPQVDLKTGEYIGVEALMRWEHPELGLIGPGEIVPVLEDTGLAREVGAWAIQEALKQIRKWSEQDDMLIDVGINLSSHQLIQRNFVEKFEKLIDQRDSKYRNHLSIEITEDMLLGDIVLAMDKLNSLDQLGIQISLDDFGSGHSSLSQLNRGYINMLKINRKYIQRVPGDEVAGTLVNSIIAIGHSMGMQITAIGVETEAQLNYLKQCGCDYVQGFLFSGAITANDVTALFKNKP